MREIPWFKVDDRLPDNRKVRKAGTAAMGLWALAGAWASGELTDGFVPKCVAIRWDLRGTLAAKLIRAELWARATQDGEDGYQFENWEEYNPTKAEVEAERAAARERMKKRRAAKRSAEQPANVQANTDRSSGVGSATPTRPIPTRPDPTSFSSGQVQREGGLSSAPPPQKCLKHINDENPPNCGRCADARRTRANWDAEHQSSTAEVGAQRRRAIDSCALCDEHGWLLTDPNLDLPLVKCDHADAERKSS